MAIPTGTIVLGLLLWALTSAPHSVHGPAIQAFNTANHLPYRFKHASVVYALKWLFGIGVVRAVNAFLNAAALNNGRYSSDKSKWTWTKEVAVVTGGCSGIGESIVKALAKKGVRVAVLDMAPLPERLNKVVAHYERCDVTDPESVNKCAAAIKSKVGPVSILVNNAGIGNDYAMLDAPPAKVKKLIEVNLISHWYTCQAFVPDMVKVNKGHVVEIASMSSFVSVGNFADYSATKVALVAFSECLREQLRNWYRAPDVHVTNVHPLWVATPLTGAGGPRGDMIEKTSGKMMTSDFLAKEVTDQIYACRGNQLVIPKRMAFVSTIRAWPNWLQLLARRGQSVSREEHERVRAANEKYEKSK